MHVEEKSSKKKKDGEEKRRGLLVVHAYHLTGVRTCTLFGV